MQGLRQLSTRNAKFTIAQQKHLRETATGDLSPTGDCSSRQNRWFAVQCSDGGKTRTDGRSPAPTAHLV